MQLPLSQDNSNTPLNGMFDEFPPLSREEEYELAVRLMEHGDVDAAQRLTTANLRHVVRIANGYRGYRLPLEDIVQEGTLGLMIAVKKFDPYKGYRFMTYAIWWIKAMIHDYIFRFYSLVKIGTTKLEMRLFYGLNRMLAEEDVMDNDAIKRSHALSARLDADPRKIEEIISRIRSRDLSLDSPIRDGEECSFVDFLMDTVSNPEHQIMESQWVRFAKSRIEGALSTLTPREQEIARLRLMTEEPQTLKNLGRQYAISKERVRQIESKVKTKLKQALDGHLDFMPQE